MANCKIDSFAFFRQALSHYPVNWVRWGEIKFLHPGCKNKGDT